MESDSGYQQLPSGKTIMRDFAPDGSLAEETHVYGSLDIGIASVFINGAKIEETYFYKGKLVGRRTYEKARIKYPDMPEPDAAMEDWGTEILRGVAEEKSEHNLESKRHKPNSGKARKHDDFCEKRLRTGKTEDAIDWIKIKGHTLGERDWPGSKRLVARLVAAGCPKVWACEVDTYENGIENTGHLVVELPKVQAPRSKVFKMIDRLARETGYSGPFDDGQKYAYIKLD